MPTPTVSESTAQKVRQLLLRRTVALHRRHMRAVVHESRAVEDLLTPRARAAYEGRRYLPLSESGRTQPDPDVAEVHDQVIGEVIEAYGRGEIELPPVEPRTRKADIHYVAGHSGSYTLVIEQQRETIGLAKGTQGQLRGRDSSGGFKKNPPEKLPTLAEAGIDKHIADASRRIRILRTSIVWDRAVPEQARCDPPESMLSEWR